MITPTCPATSTPAFTTHLDGSYAISHVETPTPATIPDHEQTSIDMVGPADVCTALSVSEAGLMALINRPELAAYDIGGRIRFRSRDVASLVDSRRPGEVTPLSCRAAFDA